MTPRRFLTRPPYLAVHLVMFLLSEYEFCSGVGGVILLLESGDAFTGESSHLISSCVVVQIRLWEKEKDCGSTNSQSEHQEETTHSSVITEDGETGTSVTSGTIRTRARESGSQSDLFSNSSKGSSQKDHHFSPDLLPLTQKI